MITTVCVVVFILANSPSASAVCLGKSVCQNMWNKAQAETLRWNIDFSVNPGQQQLYRTTLAANFRINARPEFRAFRDLLQSYTWQWQQYGQQHGRIRPSGNTPVRINDFLNLITQPGGPVEQALKYLKEKGLLPAGMTLQPQFRNRLLDMWFPPGQDRPGFQHTFVGEKLHYNWPNYNGFHNWYQFKLEQVARRVLIQNQGQFNGDSEPPFMSNLFFDWEGYPKDHGSSMFVGTSPGFEIALFSVCFIEHPGQPCSCNIGRSTVTVQTRDATLIGGTVDQISTAFPKDVVIQAGRCRVDPNFRTECGWHGINQAGCEHRGCCYDSTQPNTKWCFFPRDHKCDVIDPNDRKDCGHVGITRHACEVTNNCCYDSSVPNVPFCFKGSI